MLNIPRLVVIIALLYCAVLFIAFNFSNPRLNAQDGPDINSLTGFLEEVNDIYQAPTETTQKASTPSTTVRTAHSAAKMNPFQLLGAYPSLDAYVQPTHYNTPQYGLINDNDYCYQVDMYNLEHPENMFEKKNFFTDVTQDNVLRTRVMSQIGKMYLSHLDKLMPKKVSQSRTYHLDKEINAFVLFTTQFHKYHQIGKHFLCATQMWNHIPNQTSLTTKVQVIQSIEDYALRYEDKPQCFNKTAFSPVTYRLFVEQECKDFFKIINSEEYQESVKAQSIQYIVKLGNGAHKAQGVFPLDTDQTKTLQSDYDHGKKCGKVTKSIITQKYITNPLLLDKNNKFHMRVYLLITSSNPLIAYYQDGYIRASVVPFDKSSENKASHLTNLLVDELNQAAKDNKAVYGMTPEELDEYQIWSQQDLQDYLLETGQITDKNWLDNYLRPTLKKAFVHLVRMTGKYFWKQSNVYELLGCDFIMDDNLGVWFLEANPSPQLVGVQDDLISRMLHDLFEIQYNYYKSRMKRALDVIQRMQQETEEGHVENLDKWKQLYQEAVKNRLEPEYKLSETNSFKMILDESLPGAQAYFGYLHEECVSN